MDSHSTRRNFLKAAAGTATTGILAGCANSRNNNSGTNDSYGNGDDNSTDTPEPETQYNLEVTGLSDITLEGDVEQYLEADELDDEHYIDIELQVEAEYSDGTTEKLEPDQYKLENIELFKPIKPILEETSYDGDLDHLTNHVNPEQLEENNGKYRLPVPEVFNGTNILHLDLEILNTPENYNGQTKFTLGDTLEKTVPEHTATVLEPHQEPENITGAESPYNFWTYQQPPQEHHQHERTEYRTDNVEKIVDGIHLKNWVDTNIDDLRVDKDSSLEYPYFQRQIGRIASQWVDKMPYADTSNFAEELAMILEYAGEQHLDINIQAGAIGNRVADSGATHDTVAVRNPETEELWHTDTNGGRTGKPERFASGSRWRTSLNPEHHDQYRGDAETMATAFTRVDGLSETGENLSHTDTALKEIARLKRNDGDFSTMEQTSINAVMLAQYYPELDFEIDVASETPDNQADLEITAQPAI